jgi:HEAT repeat protein
MDMIQEQDGGTMIVKEDLIKKISQVIEKLRVCSLHDAQEEAQCFVKFIRERTGLLNEQGRDQYGFVHKTFQEYLTAAEIYSLFEAGDDEIIVTTIRAYLHQPHWREVLLLLVAMLKGKRAANAIHEIFTANSKYEQWLRRDLLFAARCLTEDPQNMKQGNQKLVNDILQGIFHLEVNSIDRYGIFIKLEIIEIFQGLVETNFQNDALDILKKRSDIIEPWRGIQLKHSLGESQIDNLLSLLKDPHRVVRAASALSELGDNSELVITELLSLCNDVKDDVRSSSALLLGKLGGDSERVITALISLCKDNDLVRPRAVEALEQLGNSSEPVIEILLSLLNDSEISVRSKAASALIKLGNSSEPVIETLFSLLKNPRDLVHSGVIKALGKIANSSDNVFITLLSLLENNQFGPSKVVSAIGESGNRSEPVIMALLSLSKDLNGNVRASVAEALGKLGNTSEPVIMTLLSLSEDINGDVRASAAEALGKLGNTSEPVIMALLSLCQDNDFVSYSAAKALGKLGNTSEPVIMALLSLLKNPETFVRSSAAEALGSLENSLRQVILPKLENWLECCQNIDRNGEAIDLLKRLVDQSAGVNQTAS